MHNAFSEIGLVIVLAALLGIIARTLKQPTILAYFATGMIVAAIGAIDANSRDILEVMATFGVTFLLFLVGLEMRFSNFKGIGKAALLTAIGQIVFTALIGYGIVRLFGFNPLTGFYIAVALTFSSTIIIVKLLSEKKDLQSLYGRIVVGFLIVQDVVAIMTLIILGSFQEAGVSFHLGLVGLSLLKGSMIIAATLWLGQTVLPWLFEKLAKSPELLFITSIAWAFGFAMFVSSKAIGFSIEIGGFLAGLALAHSAEKFQIDAKIKPLRDFFIVMFFVILGSSLILGSLKGVIVPAIVLSLFVLVGNPIIMLIIMAILGFRKRTSFLASIATAQISEFSLILVALGLKLGHIDEQAVSLVTLVGVVTFLISTYMILNNEKLFRIFSPYLKIFERPAPMEQLASMPEKQGHIILAGAHRLGQRVLSVLDKGHVVVVDFDPEIAHQLRKQNYRVIFGDITDLEIQEHVNIEKAQAVISTIPSLEDNLLILESIQELKKQGKVVPLVIAAATEEWEAKILYEEGADYVILPYLLGGQQLASLIKQNDLDLKTLNQLRKHDIQFLDRSVRAGTAS